MRTTCVVLSLSFLAPGCNARVAEPAPPVTVALPAPETDGTFSVEKALKERRSTRNPAPSPLRLEEVGQLCWAAQGVSDDKGHRTAPSAMAAYPLELRVIAGAVEGLEPGLYRYEPAQHALALVAGGDKRAAFEEKAVGQGWIAKAPALFVISGDAGKMTKMKERGAQFMWVEAGLAAQGFFLQATALGLGSTYVGGFDPEAARAALGLPDSQEVLAVLPVGRKPE
jgi:SagB-type dehydrogenase family enzyme